MHNYLWWEVCRLSVRYFWNRFTLTAAADNIFWQHTHTNKHTHIHDVVCWGRAGRMTTLRTLSWSHISTHTHTLTQIVSMYMHTYIYIYIWHILSAEAYALSQEMTLKWWSNSRKRMNKNKNIIKEGWRSSNRTWGLNAWMLVVLVLISWPKLVKVANGAPLIRSPPRSLRFFIFVSY